MPETDQPVAMTFGQKLVNIFVSPSRVFQVLVRDPAWILPLLVITLYVPLLQTITFSSEKGREAMKQEMMKNPQAAKMSEEQMESYLGAIKYIIPASTLVAIPLFSFIAAGIVYFLISII